ncbi:uncharacterized protein LOC126847185 [Adelges cooleyi]|uniref:uncharacterized protein LOC126847185 n=1 Tax=Adelges cooleyi TaxID=133065 RepID=UPI00218037EB|nr:uncharacterized protein LOC126847185 [Adelges cooleyi]
MEKLKPSENNIRGRKNNRVSKNSFLTDDIVNLNCCVTLSKCDALINYNKQTVSEPKIKSAKNSSSPDVQSFKRTTRKRVHENKMSVEDITDITCSKKQKQGKSVPKPKSPQTKSIESKINDLPQTEIIESKLVYGLPQVNTKKRRGRASNFGINFDLLLSSGTLPYLNNDLDNSIKDTTPCVKNVQAPKDNVNDSESTSNTTKSNDVVVPVPYRSRFRRCTLSKKKDLAKKTTESNKIGEKNVESHDCILDPDQMPNSVETEISSQILEKSLSTDTLPLQKDPYNIKKKSRKVRTKSCTPNDVNLMANDTQPIKIQTRATRNRKQENSSHQNIKAKLLNNKESTEDISSVSLKINSDCDDSNNRAEVFDNSAEQTITCLTEESEGGVDISNNSKELKQTLVTNVCSSHISEEIVLYKSVVMPKKTRNGIKKNDINICPENLGSSDVEKNKNLKINTKCTPKNKNRLLHSKPPSATVSQKVKNAVGESDVVPSCSETPRSPIQPYDQQDMSPLVINNQSNEKIVTKKLPIERDIENIAKQYNIPYETVKRVVLDEPLTVFREQYSKEVTPAMLTAAPIIVDLKSKSNQDLNVNYKVEPIRESMAFEKSNIKDMITELSKTMPSWSLSTVTNPARFVISKMSINDYGVPVVSKSIVLDRNFRGSVYINQTLEYKYCKQYITPAEIINLIKQINSL